MSTANKAAAVTLEQLVDDAARTLEQIERAIENRSRELVKLNQELRAIKRAIAERA